MLGPPKAPEGRESLQISGITVVPNKGVKLKGPLFIKLIVDGKSFPKLPYVGDIGAGLPLRWHLKPFLTLREGSGLVIQLLRGRRWPRNILIAEAPLSFQGAQGHISNIKGEYKDLVIRDSPTIKVEIAPTKSLQSMLDMAVEVSTEHQSVLDHLGRSRAFLEALIDFGTAVSELDPIAKAVLGCVNVVYGRLQELERWDRMVLDLAEKMARTLGYIEDVEQFARLVQLKKAIEDIRPLMEDTSTFILEFSTRGTGGNFWHSSYVRDKVQGLDAEFERFQQQFDRGIAVQSGATLAKLLENIVSSKDEKMLKTIKPKGLEGVSPIGECMAGTREDILGIIDHWVNDLEAPNILWVRGFPGVGKSAIASTLVAKLRTSHRLGSSFFFQRAHVTVTTPAALWRSVAFDLARSYPTVRSIIIEKLEDEIVDATSNVKILFRNLIEDPLKASSGIPSGRLPVIVVDALDECGGLDGRQSMDRELLLYTLKRWSRLPMRFKLVVTSRSEDDLLRALQPPLSHTIDLFSAEASKDIHLFLTARFARIAGGYPGALPPTWPGPAVIDKLTKRADGLFLWAKTVTEFVDAGEPQGQLAQILSGFTGPGDMTVLYKNILAISFRIPSPEVLDSFNLIVGAIILAKTPLTRKACIDLVSVEPTMLDFIRKGLQSVMDSGDTLRFSHQSFVDFLLDPKRCPEAFLIDEGSRNRAISFATFHILETQLRFNICGLETSYNRNSDILDLDARIQEAIPAHVDYSCRFWADHLEDMNIDSEIIGMVKVFMHTQFLYWLEVLSLLNEVHSVMPVLRTVLAWCGDSDVGLVGILKDALRFMAAFGTVISQSAPHIYLSALPFAPAGSKVAQAYLPSFPQVLRIGAGRVIDWPAIQYVLEEHEGSVYSVSFSQDGKHIVSGSGDKTIVVCDAETGDVVSGPFERHTSSVNSVAFSRDGKQVVSGSDDQTILVWDVDTGDLVSGPFVGHTNVVTTVAFSQDGRRIASGSYDGTIRVWDLKTVGLALEPFVGHRNAVTSVSFSWDDTRIASGSHDQTVLVWNAHTGDIIAGPFEEHTGWVNSVAFSWDGKLVASGSDDATIIVWDAVTGGIVAGPLDEHTDGVNSVAFSQDGARIVSGSHDETIRVWNVATEAIILGPLRGHTNGVTSVAFSKDGKRIVSGSRDETIRVWDAEIRETMSGPFEGHVDGVNSVAFSQDGKRIVSGSDDETIRIWDAETGKAISGPLEGHSSWIDCVAFSPDGGRIASGSDDQTILIWDVEKSEVVLGPLKGHTSGITSLAFSSDGRRIVSGSYDNTVRVWETESGASVTRPFTGHTAWVTSVMFSSNGRCIVSGSFDKTIRLWDARTGAPILGPFIGHTAGVRSVALSKDAKRVVSGSGDGEIRVWNAETGDALVGPLLAHANLIATVAFSENGKWIVSGSHDKTIRFWDSTTGNPLSSPLEGHTEGITCVALSPNNKYIASCSGDETIRVWDVDLIFSKTYHGGASNSAFADASKMGSGWVLGSNSELLFWVPPWNRSGLWWPRNKVVIAEMPTKLDLTFFKHGTRWDRCRVPI